MSGTGNSILGFDEIVGETAGIEMALGRGWGNPEG